MKMTKIGRPEHRLLSDTVLDALKDVETRFNVKFSTSGGMTGQNRGMIKLDVEIADVGGGMSAAEANFRATAHYYGLSPDDFGKTIRLSGATFKIAGISPSRPKNPIDIERIGDGKSYKCPAHTIKLALPKPMAAAA